MTKEIFINHMPFETRLALIDDGVLQQIHIDRNDEPSLVGNIYKAKVLRVMPGMQSAFVDIGSERNAFLPIDNIPRAKAGDKIADILRDGQEILVQVVKDPVNKKGALLTTDLSIATDYLVYRHGRSKPGISVKIKQKQERSRLNELMDSIISSSELPESLRGNFIVRSAADGISANELTADINCFIDIWQSIEVLKLQKSPIVVYQESHRFHRLINAMFAQGINRLTVDCAEFLKQINQWCDLESHEPKIHAELFAAKGNVFDSYQIEEQINAALDVEVALDCGGYLVIEQTEALSVIDVNTGSYIGDSADKNTFYKVNIEAAIESAKQIRLRNLSGIIIIDFIDMQNVDHRRKVLKELKNAFLDDPISNKISDFTEFGLVQIARKRTSRSLSQILCAPFKHSEARGVNKSEETLCLEIIRELIKIESNCAWKSIEICTSSAIIEILNNKYSTQLNDFKSSTHCDVKLSPDRAMKSNQYNIIPTR
jgi:ribonuclease G